MEISSYSLIAVSVFNNKISLHSSLTRCLVFAQLCETRCIYCNSYLQLLGITGRRRCEADRRSGSQLVGRCPVIQRRRRQQQQQQQQRTGRHTTVRPTLWAGAAGGQLQRTRCASDRTRVSSGWCFTSLWDTSAALENIWSSRLIVKLVFLVMCGRDNLWSDRR